MLLNKTNYLVGFVLLYLLFACTASKMLVSDVHPSTVNKIAYFQPYSYISLIENKNQSEINEELSLLSEKLIDSLVQTKSKFRIEKKLKTADDFTNSQIEMEVTALINESLQYKNIQDIELTPTIRSLMETQNSDYALAIIASGFTRRKGNYGKQVAKGIGIGILTLGLVAPIPVKANTTLHFLLCDRRNNNIALYRNSFLEKDPLDQEAINRQIDKVMEDYFISKK